MLIDSMKESAAGFACAVYYSITIEVDNFLFHSIWLQFNDCDLFEMWHMFL